MKPTKQVQSEAFKEFKNTLNIHVLCCVTFSGIFKMVFHLNAEITLTQIQTLKAMTDIHVRWRLRRLSFVSTQSKTQTPSPGII